MNRLINSPQNLGKTEPLAYIEATRRAGYDGIGIRTYRAPGRTYNFNPIVGHRDLERDVKNALVDCGLEVYDLYSFYLQPQMDWDTITPALEFGGRIGCKYVLIIGDDPEWNRMVDTMGPDDRHHRATRHEGRDRGLCHGAHADVNLPKVRCGVQPQVRRHVPGPAPAVP